MSDGFHLGEIDIESRPLFAERLANDDFSPLFRDPRDRLQIFGSKLPCCHDIVILEVRPIRQGEFPIADPITIPARRKGRLALVALASQDRRKTVVASSAALLTAFNFVKIASVSLIFLGLHLATLVR